MGIADLDAFIDARRAPTNRVHPNAGTVDSLRATIEGDCVTVDGPAVVLPADGIGSGLFSLSAFGASDGPAGSITVTWEQDDFLPNQSGNPVYHECADTLFLAFGDSSANPRSYWREEDGTQRLVGWSVSDRTAMLRAGVFQQVFTVNGADLDLTLRYGPTEGDWTEELTQTVTNTSLRFRDRMSIGGYIGNASGEPGMIARSLKMEVDGVTRGFTAADIPDDTTATTITGSLGGTFTIARDTSGPTTLLVPAGRSMIVNPDESDSGNRVTTGQGIVTSASAVFDGASGTYLSSPDADALDITGDLCIVAKVALDDWTPATTNALVAKWTASNVSFALVVLAAGTLQLQWSTDGSATTTETSSAGVGATDGEHEWIAATLDVDDGASDAQVKFWTGGSGAVPAWSQLGSTQAVGSTTSVFAGNAVLEIGARDDNIHATGSVEYVAVYDGIGDHSAPALGDLVFALDESDLARGAEGEDEFPASTGQTISVNGNVGWSVSAWEGVEPTATFDGTDDYESVPDEAAFDITGDLCIVAKAASDDWASAGFNVLLSKYENSGDERSFMFTVSAAPDLRIYWSTDGTGGTVTSEDSDAVGFADGDVAQWVAVTFDVDNGASGYDIKFWTGGTGEHPVWAQLGSTIVGGAATSIYSGTADIQIAAYSDDTALWDGAIPYVALYDGIGDHSAPGLGTLVFERNQVDIARAAAAGVTDGQTYPSASGHTVTSHGGVTYTGTAPLVIPRGTHVLLGGTFVIGNQTGAQPYALNLGDYPNEWWGITRAAASDTARTYFDDGPAAASSGFAAFDPTELLAFFASLDWDADLIRFVIIDAAGAVVTATTASIAAIDRFIPTEGLAALYTGSGLPGALGSIVFDKRTTAPYDVTEGGEVATFATSLLTAYTPTVGDRRLGTPASISKRLN